LVEINFMQIIKIVNTVLDKGYKLVLLQKESLQKILRFGNKKNHYSLAKIKAKTLVSELAWVFFGNLTANAMAIVKKRKPPSPLII